MNTNKHPDVPYQAHYSVGDLMYADTACELVAIPSYTKPCPCSDHIFKLVKKQFRVVPIADAWDDIAQLRKNAFVTAFRAKDCDAIRAGEHASGFNVDRNHVMHQYRLRDYTQLTRDSPVFVLAAYSSYVAGRTLQCTHVHANPVCDIYRLIREYVHMPRVREAFANAIADDMLAPGVTNIAGAVDMMARFIQQSCIEFINMKTPIELIHICDIVRICAREVQDELIRARMDCDCVWWLVPKDVIKIIHRMVFDDYIIP